MTVAANTVDTASKPRQHSMLGSFLSIVKFALVFGFLVNLGVNFYYWGSKGYSAAIDKIATISANDSEAIAARSQIAAGYSLAVIQKISLWADELTRYAEHKTPNVHIADSLKPSQKESELLDNFKVGWHQFWSILFGTAVEVVIKFTSIFASFLVYVFALLLGAIDGLVQREIRRAEGGRESTFLFHKVADMILKIPGLILIVFLACPISLNPLIAVYSMAFMFFCFTSVLFTNWKKNL